MGSRLQSQYRRPVKLLIFIAVGIVAAGLVWILLHGMVLSRNYLAGTWRVMSSAEAKKHRSHMMVAAHISTLKAILDRYKSITGQ